MRFASVITVLIILLIGVSNVCGGIYDLDTEIPIMERGKNVRIEKSERFSTVTVSYDICVVSIANVAAFYNDFFLSLGWNDPLNEQKTIIQFRWAARRMTFSNDDKPEAIYANTWKANEIPAKGTLQLSLTDYNGQCFEGNVKVVLSPDIDISPLMEINRLIGDNPKFFFELSKAVKGNPFKIDTIEIPHSFQGLNDQMFREYYKLAKQIIDRYSDFRKKYIKK